MNGYLIFAAFVGVCVARPDIGLKLRQQGLVPPATNYGVPVGYLPPTGGDHSGTNQHNYFQTQTSSGGSGQQSHGGSSHSGFTGSGQSSFGGSITSGFTGSGQSSSGGFSQSGFSNERYDGSSSGSTLVNKHIYFFDSPEDIPAPKIRIHQQQAQSKKDYNIIFIKAPNYQAPQVQVPAVQQQNSEKTLVYVLVKKPEDVKDIEIPSIAPSKPSKPEVFFIKYKNQKEAQEKIQHIQNGGSADEIVSTDLGNDASFVNTIRDDASSNNVIVTGSGGYDSSSGGGSGHISSSGGSTTFTGTSSHHSGGHDSGFDSIEGIRDNHGFEHGTSGSSGSGITHQGSVSGPYKK